jgi:hypothetical protein
LSDLCFRCLAVPQLVLEVCVLLFPHTFNFFITTQFVFFCFFYQVFLRVCVGVCAPTGSAPVSSVVFRRWSCRCPSHSRNLRCDAVVTSLACAVSQLWTSLQERPCLVAVSACLHLTRVLAVLSLSTPPWRALFEVRWLTFLSFSRFIGLHFCLMTFNQFLIHLQLISIFFTCFIHQISSLASFPVMVCRWAFSVQGLLLLQKSVPWSRPPPSASSQVAFMQSLLARAPRSQLKGACLSVVCTLLLTCLDCVFNFSAAKSNRLFFLLLKFSCDFVLFSFIHPWSDSILNTSGRTEIWTSKRKGLSMFWYVVSAFEQFIIVVHRFV